MTIQSVTEACFVLCAIGCLMSHWPAVRYLMLPLIVFIGASEIFISKYYCVLIYVYVLLFLLLVALYMLSIAALA